MSDPVTVYHYPGCSTCLAARKWLDEHGVGHELAHIVQQPPSRTTLRKVSELSGRPIPKLFNTSGNAYREGGFSDRLPTMSEDEMLDALTADGMLIKRPLVVGDDVGLVGFDADEYERVLT